MMLQNLETITVQWTLGGDQKFINLAIGVGPHSSMYPCAYCMAEHTFSMDTNLLRTFGDIRREYAEYQADLANYESGRSKKKPEPMDYTSCINPCLLPFPDEMYVVVGCPPPELHLTLRNTNHNRKLCFKEWAAVHNDGSDPGQDFLLQHTLVPASYQGHDLDGNKCLEFLRLHEELRIQLPLQLKKWADVFSTFLAVVESCFTVAAPPDNFMDDIEAYSRALDACNVSHTPSIHTGKYCLACFTHF